ncbi:lipoate--protein ligase family protein [Desulfomonile tiedjei]|uniref:Lipoate-protein ligase A n=1 Tax=Desulfomonile tiedjei (strain ATCC 49306 / DSM 6799 / DCB-1) TaxID=706587 RepID=I4C1M6_DESTA|nr:biotin/lipoate A/B protein ligase family protein [Desulfomonile tiedjei]AFM23467.1 lipoate-protein ligase A [Desulfomonile tiedjei DSM 6799]
MELYNLGRVPWEQSQLIYHALAYLGREAMCTCFPATPYFSIGYHQDISQEVDLDFSTDNKIPVFRREVGGGAVYLDSNQVFFQLVLHQKNPHISMCREAFYRKFLEPVVKVYRRLGIPAHYRRTADIAVGDRKISGIGAGEIGDCAVLVGNVILDFDFDTMCKMLRMPDESFRARVRAAMEDNMTTVRREIGNQASRWNQAEIAGLLVAEFEKLLGSFVPHDVDSELRCKMEELQDLMTTRDWLHQNNRPAVARIVTIRSGLQLCQESVETPVGPMSIEFEIRDGVSAHVSISGEACQHPGSEFARLESALIGISPKEIRTAVSEHFAPVQMPTPILTDEPV